MFGRAKSVLKGWTSPGLAEAQYYQVRCVNGHVSRGERTEGYQAFRCPSCDEGLFVLPISPLPEPRAPEAAARKAEEVEILRAYDDEPTREPDVELDDGPIPIADRPVEPMPISAPEADVAEIDWVDEEPAPAPARTAARPKPVEERPPAQRPRPAVARPQTRPVEVETPAPRRNWSGWVSDHRHALIVSGFVLMVVGAIAYRRHRTNLEQMPKVAERGRLEGIKKLDNGDFFAAKKILAEASDAVDALSGRVEGGEAIKQAAREAAIYTDLVPKSLEELVEEATTYRPATGWSSHFDGLYAGRSVIVETQIVDLPDPNRPGSALRDAYQILTGPKAKPNVGRLRLDDLNLFANAKLAVGEPKLFGARLESLEFDDGENAWIFRFEPDSGVYLTHAQALEGLGWPASIGGEGANP